MARGRRTTYLIQDPYDFDAVEFIRTIDAQYGYRPVCLYTDPKAQYYGQQQFPLLTGDRIERSYNVERADLATVVEELTDRYDVAGVVPYREDTIEMAADLCGHLDLDWNQPQVLQRFRNKHELKRHVETVDPCVRIPAHYQFSTPEELENGPVGARFVVKPNNGFGNSNVGIFEADQLEEARAHVAAHPGMDWIVEEFIGGTEYHIDGFVRDHGEVRALAVFEYVRTEVNGYPTVYLGEILVDRQDPIFAMATDYAARLLKATGLRNCPFHLEVKVDDQGPCVVDLGARFLSESGSYTLTRLHPTLPPAHAVASALYLGHRPPDDHIRWPCYDWSGYDAARTVLVYGVSTEEGPIASLSGLDEIEARPEFIRWAVRPRIGDQLTATKDLRGAPYIVELSCEGSREDALRLMEEVRGAITWNDAPSATQLWSARARQLWSRARRKSRWLTHRALGVSAPGLT